MSPAPSVALVILDGFGLAPDGPGNAVSIARTPTFDGLWERYPHAQLIACGPAVGLPEGQMGNSEVGHLNLGAGAVVKQDLMRIDEAVRDGSIAATEAIRRALSGDAPSGDPGDAIGSAGEALSPGADDAPSAGGPRGRRVHLIGLVSDGGVHSSMEHLHALIRAGVDQGVSDLVIHAFTDGRDTLPTGGAGYLQTVQDWAAEASTDATTVRIGSVIGRYFAMDRDQRWDRVQQAFDLLVHGTAFHHADTAVQAVQDAYGRDETDEFVAATSVGDEATIRPGDAVVVTNFRPDRVREITRALAEPGFDEIDRRGEGDDPQAPVVAVDDYVCMTTYKADWPYPVAFPPRLPEITLADVIEASGAAQVHVAETEKYPHVTYFFNGGIEDEHRREYRDVVPSPRDVATYDEKPQMSAREAADAFIRLWGEREPRFGIINFANPDMVGHTGSIPAAVTAIEFVDSCLADVVETVTASGGVLIVTADHGNADHMLEPDGSPNTAHSLNPVPFVVTREGVALRDEGILADVAPTVLDLLGIEQPAPMTGESMIASPGA